MAVRKTRTRKTSTRKTAKKAPLKKGIRNRIPVSAAFWVFLLIVIIIAFFMFLPKIKNLTLTTKTTETEQVTDERKEKKEEGKKEDERKPSEEVTNERKEKKEERKKEDERKTQAEKPAVTEQPDKKPQTEKPAAPAQPSSPPSTPAAPVSTPPVKPVETRDRSIYLIQESTMMPIKVNRKLNVSNTPLLDSINALLAGPTADERRSGKISLIPEGSRLIKPPTIIGTTVQLDFNQEFRFNQGGIDECTAQLKQIVWTATEFQNIDDVQFLIEGKKVDFFREGVVIRDPIGK